jgi:23S rRNA pseudouridine2605 synthase
MSRTLSQYLRLDRLLVSRGIGGRKEVQKLIRRGYVIFEDEELRDPSQRYSNQISLVINGELSEPLPALIVYHKPLHQLCTLKDPWGRGGLDHVLPPEWRDSLHPVGRLDAETTGLLLFSSDGQLTQHLLHPKRELTRSYRAVVQTLPADLKIKLQEGVQTSSGTFRATVEALVPFNVDEHASFIEGHPHLSDIGGVIWLSVTEGKHRMVRRMLHNAGASVLSLHRERYGHIELGELTSGEYRVITSQELQTLQPHKD